MLPFLVCPVWCHLAEISAILGLSWFMTIEDFFIHVFSFMKNTPNENITFKDFDFDQLTLPLSALLSGSYKELSSILADQ
jgi:hypothetical protein